MAVPPVAPGAPPSEGLAPSAGFVSGMPGGMSGPPGGLAAPPLAPLTLLAPLPGAMQSGPLAIAGGGLPGAAVPMAAAPGGAAPATLSGAPGGAFPGAGAPLALPDLNAAARTAMERVMERAPEAPPAAPAAQTAIPGLWGPPPGARTHRYTPPPPPPALHPPPGLHPGAPFQGQARRAEVVTGERDLAQRAGDALYPLVERIRESRAGWIGVVALFGLTVPIVLLRQRFDVRVRLILSGLVFLLWFGLIMDLL
jgi:hypothetical protein